MRSVLTSCIRAACGSFARFADLSILDAPCIYFANHTSHLDFAVLWANLPTEARNRCIPIAAKDYWNAGPIRRILAKNFLRAVLVDREHLSAHDNPLVQMDAALARGDSLIIFPEGTRSLDGQMRPFKPGLFHLARRNPEVPLVPVYLENLNRILPKGELLPVPLLSTITFGRPMRLRPRESKSDFLTRTQDALKELHYHDD
jgi:1-acyl-sn-glycerol-3-phosphate acyltransferase